MKTAGATDRSLRSIALCIGGRWVETDAEPADLTSPATGELVAQVAQGSRGDVGRAVEAAQRAVEQLGRMTAFERAGLCHRVADLLLERKDEIATDLALEQGKPFRAEAIPEVETAAEMFRDAGECAKRLATEWIPSSDPPKRAWTIRQARGVYGVLTP